MIIDRVRAGELGCGKGGRRGSRGSRVEGGRMDGTGLVNLRCRSYYLALSKLIQQSSYPCVHSIHRYIHAYIVLHVHVGYVLLGKHLICPHGKGTQVGGNDH